MKVILQKNLYERGQAVFDKSSKEQGIEYLTTDALDETAMLLYHRQGVSCFVIGAEKYSDTFYQAIAQGAAVIRFGVGYNAVPIAICRSRQINVAYTPGTLTQSVAEHTFALLLALARDIPALNASVKAGKWEGASGVELAGKTLTILGLGQIGQAVARIAKYGFSMKVNAYDICTTHQPDFVDLLSSDYAATVQDADFISMHMAALPETAGFFNARTIHPCKDGVFFINTARGELVAEKDLYEALQSGKIAKAALDVFGKEPYHPDSSTDFRKLNNVILSPHFGSNTKEANNKMAEAVVTNILAYYNHTEMTLIPELMCV
jgi:D-3-phosphoglycerate dehydrogenase